MEPGVVMGDFLDDRIDELEKKLNECNEKLENYMNVVTMICLKVFKKKYLGIQTLGQPMKSLIISFEKVG